MDFHPFGPCRSRNQFSSQEASKTHRSRNLMGSVRKTHSLKMILGNFWLVKFVASSSHFWQEIEPSRIGI